jgi:acetyl/propionyl-CoA carboxylase alpha subunit/acetyl-CoA carboxylase carboxyltransferase component
MQIPFKRIAIVNRGEPAMRLIHTVRELNEQHRVGLSTIALYTEPDRDSMFVRESERSVLLGPATFWDPRDGERKSKYLDYEALERALTESKAQAAWVGWGFVAEHAEFAALCSRLGIVFIGPDGDVMRRVGDKIASKMLAEGAGVRVAPWTGGPVETVDEAMSFGDRIGFPVMIKATAGGGGRGVRRVRSRDQLADAFRGAKAEALKFFGNGTVFLEKAIVGARHVEVQVLADQYDTCWAVGVRDCTIQRRNQKVMEEAPCPVLAEKVEGEIREAAVRLCRAAKYVNAGTVEFLFDAESQIFFFMEMNTRLQVEHPVTEATTGLDLVRMQLFIASGGRLDGPPPATVGHAIEVRLNAEDADNQFSPAPGRIAVFRLPTGPGVRVDTGVTVDDSVAPDFDSMIAKVVAFGRTREEAAGRLRRALLESVIVIRGGTTNRAFLLELLQHQEVLANRTDIGWLDRVWESGQRPERANASLALILAAIDVYDAEFALEKKNFFVFASRGRPMVRGEMGCAVELRHSGQTYKLATRRIGPNDYRIYVDGRRVEVTIKRRGEFETWLTCGERRHHMVSVVDEAQHLVEVDGIPHRVSRDDGGFVRAPAPAVVLSVGVSVDARVEKGEPLCVLEAMKMEMTVLSSCSGRVRAVLVDANAQVVAGAPLLALEPDGSAMEQDATERVTFDEVATNGIEQPSARQSMLEIRRLMLGYDVDSRESAQARAVWNASREASTSFDAVAWEGEIELLRIFADLVGVTHEEPTSGFEQRMGGEETFLQYLRSVRGSGDGFTPSFIDKLSRALAHFGVKDLKPSPELDCALVYIYKAQRRLDECALNVNAVLDHWVQNADSLAPHVTEDVRDLLDRLITATQDNHVLVNDLARQSRYCLFDRPRFEAAQVDGLRQVREAMARILNAEPGEDVPFLMARLAQSTLPLHDLLSRALSEHNRELMHLALEVTVRRVYGARELTRVRGESADEYTVVSADYRRPTGAIHTVIATGARLAELARLGRSVNAVTTGCGVADSVSLDIYVAYDEAFDRDSVKMAIADALRDAGFERVFEYISVVLWGTGRGKPISYFTFVASAKGVYSEHEVFPGMHPIMAQRMEVWRLNNFDVKQLPTPDPIYVFHGTARDNPKDERLFALVDVRDMTPRLDAQANVVEVPYFEYLFLEALTAIREVQSRRSARDRLQWNRLVLFVSPVADFSPANVKGIAKRLLPPTKNLGLEKVVVHVRVRDEKSGVIVPRVFNVSNRLGTGLHIKLQEPSEAALRPLDTYTRKVVQLQRLALVYPYEIIRMLTPSGDGEHAEFPPGKFVEYDLDERGSLVPVARAPGQNCANVVVGLICNFTSKHPEGMTRVLLLSDASREMGALAEAECARIMAAFDLAAKMQVPVDWFPVSSGAKIAMDVGTEALDAVARVLRRIVEYSQGGGEANVIVSGVNVGAQSYWDAEATMLMHTRGILVMTPPGSMVLTGKRALDYSGGVSAETNQGIGGFERIMGPNGQAQYFARDISEACQILFRHHEHCYVVPGERFPRRAATADPANRNVCLEPHADVNSTGFATVGDVFSDVKNPGRKKPFDIRSVMRAVIDKDLQPFERWRLMRNAETAVTWDAHLGGIPISLIAIESKQIARIGFVPADGPDTWTGGTLFPQSSKKVARAINAASRNRPVVVLANLSGFDGSPESMRELQLEYGAEIGRSVVNFEGPMVFCVISRYHGGAYVVFSRTLNDRLRVVALEGSHASVIGGAPAAAVVFSAEVKARTLADSRVAKLKGQVAQAQDREKSRIRAEYDEMYRSVYAAKQGEVAEYFDRTHSVQRARDAGSLHEIVAASRLRAYLIEALEREMASESGSIPGQSVGS